MTLYFEYILRHKYIKICLVQTFNFGARVCLITRNGQLIDRLPINTFIFNIHYSVRKALN